MASRSHSWFSVWPLSARKRSRSSLRLASANALKTKSIMTICNLVVACQGEFESSYGAASVGGLFRCVEPRAMSAIGTKRTLHSTLNMSAFGGKADLSFMQLHMSANDPLQTFAIFCEVRRTGFRSGFRMLACDTKNLSCFEMQLSRAFTDGRNKPLTGLHSCLQGRWPPPWSLKQH